MTEEKPGGIGKGDHLYLFESQDLKSWTFIGDFLKRVRHGQDHLWGLGATGGLAGFCRGLAGCGDAKLTCLQHCQQEYCREDSQAR